jgi:hypothetical protein
MPTNVYVHERRVDHANAPVTADPARRPIIEIGFIVLAMICLAMVSIYLSSLLGVVDFDFDYTQLIGP